MNVGGVRIKSIIKVCLNNSFVAQHLFYETGGLGYTKLHCAPHLMHFAPSAALSGYPIYHLDVLAVI